jgi:glutamate-1-semialdehyde aminotransferase
LETIFLSSAHGLQEIDETIEASEAAFQEAGEG